ncbi:unnamed protein product [Orchesella dallaii]|uniref:Uncharacterized protein n=1 Tax=Orchesella dallaii TaxID=48710 RepID=A0ABP1Q5Q5_9HEXA
MSLFRKQVLHVATVILVIVGVFSMPTSTAPLVVVAKRRGVFWIAVECIYTLISVAALALWVSASSRTSLRSKISNNCPNINFFYYTLMAMFVLYGTMTGCNIPYLFNKDPFYSTSFPPVPTEPWQVFTISGVALSILNSVLYLIAAFYPVLCFDEEGNAKKQQDASPTDDAPTQGAVPEIDLSEANMGENVGVDGEQDN